ncbi:conserved hypothetical protein [Sporisorium reilianum SRZ2]|uniref:Conserved oligomeric Golgi complex subunit 5 n=1 Tax=Sporisorium reilianum (strain SRZ2) TaxID=999809 RepID=E7A2D9_SPORE|nr:conserved hypothetical protein [Sporisorium reilianum SRZ2]
MQTAAAASVAGRAATSPSPTPQSQPDVAQAGPSKDGIEAQGADLSVFLQSSFDASSYVSALLADVDTTFESKNKQHDSSTAKHLALPPSPTRRPSLSLPTLPTSSSSRTQQAQEDLDLSLAISRLNLAIEELDRSISTQVNANAPDLLRRTSNLARMQSGIGETQQGLKGLDEEVQRLRGRVHDPFVKVVALQRELRVVDGASELVRRTRGVVGLARRLEGQMEALFARKDAQEDVEDAVVGQVHGRDLSRAALLVAELTSLLDAERLLQNESEASLLDLKLVQDLVPTIDTARKTIIDYMEDMIVRGLRDLSPLMLGSALQTAFNMRMLPTLVQDLLNDLTEVVKERTASAFDLDALAHTLHLPLPSLDPPPAASYSTYRSGRRATDDDAAQHQHQHHQQTWCDSVWKRLEALIVVEMGAVCSKVYLLEKVLKLKSSDAGVNWLDAALEVLGDKPSYTFWLTLAQSMQRELAAACARSAWLAQLLSVGGGKGGDGYPRLVRLVHEFFGKISVYTDVQYSGVHQSAETVILFKSLGVLEKAYVDRNTARVAEVLAHAASPPGAGATRAVVGEDEAEAVVRSIANVLDATRFDALLSRAVVARCAGLVDEFATRIDGAASRDDWTSGGENGAATQAQAWNAGLVRFAYTLCQGLTSVAADQDTSIQPSPSTTAPAARTSTTTAATQLTTAAQTLLTATRTSLLHPLLTHLSSTLATTMAKMHVQLASQPRIKPERGVAIDATSGASAYASAVCDTVWRLGERVLPLYPLELRTALAGAVARRVVALFCLHASVVSLPSAAEEADRTRLRLATDMTEFEFALSQLVGDRPAAASAWVRGSDAEEWVGTAWMKTIRAFRRLVFLSLAEVEREVDEAKLELPRALVVLQLVSRTAALDAVLHEVVGAGRETGAAQGKAEFVQWMQDASKAQVLERLRSVLPIEGVDEQTQRIVARLLQP